MLFPKCLDYIALFCLGFQSVEAVFMVLFKKYGADGTELKLQLGEASCRAEQQMSSRPNIQVQ